MLASRIPRHSLARDVGTGNGQAALCHYDRVIATGASATQLKCAVQHRRVHYVHTPIPISNDEIDLPNFYSLLTRLLQKPGGVVAVWCYNGIGVSSTFDPIRKRFHETTLPFWDPNTKHISDGYEKFPFPFESVGLGCEGFLRVLWSWSVVATAKERGFDPLSEGVVRELEDAWGGTDLVRCIVYKALMLAGTR
ncbi:hypothetical protein ACJRO7_033589 [Eucalyptus globulus]|uniref:Uncharacterized protein n=1 Tax=Eucalyptus globulus TaxID=34317 RepID=A0ABD3JPQ3_EUCGL